VVPLLGAAALLGGYRLVERWPRPEPVAIIAPATATPAPLVTPSPPPLTVHIVGAVEEPGVYALPSGSRLDDLVRLAGGLSEDADVERVNLADYLRDAQQVHIPRRGSTPPPAPTSLGGEPAAGSRTGPGVSVSAGLVNVNTATQAELERLPGIGPAKARDIIAYREANSAAGQPAFARAEDLAKVKGIGPATVTRLASMLEFPDDAGTPEDNTKKE